jgi:hypothetical protein
MEDQEEDVEQKIEEDDPVGNQMSNSRGKADSSERGKIKLDEFLSAQ